MRIYTFLLTLILTFLLTTILSCKNGTVTTGLPSLDSPYSPSNLVANGGDSLVTLSWDDINGVKFNIYYGKGSGLYDGKDAIEGESPVVSESNSFTLTGLSNGIKYYIAITAFDSERESTFSSEVMVTPTPTKNPPKLTVILSNPLQFSCAAGGIGSPQYIKIGNEGSDILTFYSISDSPWISLIPASGSIGGSSEITATVNVNCTNLVVGTYSGNLRIVADGILGSPVDISISVTVSISGPDPEISLTPNNFNLTCVQGGGVSTQMNIIISGSGILNWTAPDNVSWLSLIPDSGTTSSPVMLNISCEYLPVGNDYPAIITVTSPGVEPKTATVNLTVIPQSIDPPSWVTADEANQSIYLKWENVVGATYYRVHWGTESGVYNNYIDVPTVHYNITGLTNGATYYIAITSSKGNLESNYSTEVTAVPTPNYSIYELLPTHDAYMNEVGVVIDDIEIQVGAVTGGIMKRTYLKYNFSSQGILKAKIVESRITMYRLGCSCGTWLDLYMFSINDYGTLGIEDWNLDLPANGGYNFDIETMFGYKTDVEFNVPLNILKDGNNSFMVKVNSAGKLYDFPSSTWADPSVKPYLFLKVQNY